ncbi:MAG: TonB family protein [Myxococcota bacterium]|jgi:TonB family protein
MNKLAITALSAAATALVLAVPVASQEIVVSLRSNSSYVAEVSKDLDARLAGLYFDPHWDVHGIAKVRFQVGPDGRAINVVTYEGSGNGRLDAAARHVVHRLTSLAPMPVGIGSAQVIQANIIVADSQWQMARLTRKLARDEAARIASSPRERAVLALASVPRVAS